MNETLPLGCFLYKQIFDWLINIVCSVEFDEIQHKYIYMYIDIYNASCITYIIYCDDFVYLLSICVKSLFFYN